MRIIHIPCRSASDPLPVLASNLGKLGSFPAVCVVSTAQHLDRIGEIKKFLESAGKRVFDGGQVLGCRRVEAMAVAGKVDCFLYIGSGRFHPLGLALESGKPVFVLNPLSQALDEVSGEETASWKRNQAKRLRKAAAARLFGVLVSTKDGQCGLGEARKLKKRLESRGFKAFMFAGDELSPGNLLPFKVDCWVNTACPRLVEDDYGKPVLNPEELGLVFSGL